MNFYIGKTYKIELYFIYNKIFKMESMNQPKNIFSLKSFPLDIIRHICSYGYVEYKENMSKICDEIHYNSFALQGNIEYMYCEYRQFLRNIDLSFICYLERFVVDELIEKLFYQCTHCYCCTKHCHNRPTSLYTDEVTNTYENTSENYECNCNCRHLSRNIKRIYSNKNRIDLYVNANINNLFIHQTVQLKPVSLRQLRQTKFKSNRRSES